MINGNGKGDLTLKSGGKLEHAKVTASMNKGKKGVGQAALLSANLPAAGRFEIQGRADLGVCSL